MTIPMYCQYNQDPFYSGGAPAQVAPPSYMERSQEVPMYCQYTQEVYNRVDTNPVENIYYNPYYQNNQTQQPIVQPNSFPPQPNIMPMNQAPMYGNLQQNVYNPYMQPQQQEGYKRPPEGGFRHEQHAPSIPGQEDKQQVFYSGSGMPYVFNLPQGQQQQPQGMINPINPFSTNGYMGSYYSGNMYYDPYSYTNWVKEQEELAKKQRESDAYIRKKMLRAYFTIHDIPFTEEIEKEIDRQNEAYITPPPPPQMEDWEIKQERLLQELPYMVPCTQENPNWDIYNMRVQLNQIHQDQKRLNPDDIGVVQFFNEYAGIIETEAELLESKRQRNSKNAYYSKEKFNKEYEKAMLDESTYCNDLEVDGQKFYAPRFGLDENGKPCLEIKGPTPINGIVKDANGDEWLNDTPTSMLRDREARRQMFFEYCLHGADEYERKLKTKGVHL